MSVTVTINSVDRTSTVDGVEDLSVEDVRGAGIPTVTLKLQAWVSPWSATAPTHGLDVQIAEGSRTLFRGLITRIDYMERPRHSGKWYYHCTVTSRKTLLDRVRVYERYTGTTYADEVIADAPVLYCRMDELSGTNLIDASGFGRTGTYQSSGVTYEVTGAVSNNTAVTFDGTNGAASVPDSSAIDLGDTFSFECWVKRGATGAAHTICTKGANGFALAFGAADNYVYLSKPGVANICRSSAITDTTTWHHIVATKNGATYKIYIDGADDTTDIGNQTCTSTAVDFHIGENAAGAERLNGSMDECALYATALSSARVAAHYAARNRIGMSASDIADDLMTTYGPTGFSLVCEAGLEDVAEIQFDGCTLNEAYEQLAAYIGGIYYYNEDDEVHLYASSDGAVEQPDTLTGGAGGNCQSLTKITDATQIVTRQCVEGEGTTLAAPLSLNDTAVYVVDADAFPDAGTVKVYSTPSARYAHSGRSNWKARTTVSSGDQQTPLLAVTSHANFPDAGWVLVNDSIPVQYHTKGYTVAGGHVLLTEGCHTIHSLTTAGTTATLVVHGAGSQFINSANTLTIGGTGVGDWAGSYTIASHPSDDTYTFTFVGPKSPASLSDTGYAYSYLDVQTATLTRAGREVTATCAAPHFCAVGDWVSVSSATEPDYTGEFLVTRVPSAANMFQVCFELGDGRTPGKVTDGALSLVGRIPSTLTGGWNVDACPVLTGVTVTVAAPSGTAAHIWAQCDDSTAQTNLAAADGTDGVKEGPPIIDHSLSYAAAVARGNAELTVRKNPETRLSYVATDVKTRAGTEVTANVVCGGVTVTGDHKITRVGFSQFKEGGTAPILREVETSDQRYTPADLFRQWALRHD